MPVKSQESIGPCEVSLDIEVESAKVAQAVDRAYREFSKYIAVPGFRKGKAPMAFVRQRVPQDQLRERTAELLMAPAYQEAIAEREIQAFAQPRVELVKLETTPPDYVFEFKARVPLPPKVVLGEYLGLSVEREILQVSDQDVESRISSIRERAAEYPEIEDRPAEFGDVVVGDLAVTPESPDDDTVVIPEFQSTAITLGDPNNVPGVDDALIGVNKGDVKEFDLVYPDEYPQDDLAGKRAHFVLRVNELRKKILPEIDVEFAKRWGGVDTVEALNAKIRADLERGVFETANTHAQGKLVDQIVSNATIDYPSVLVDVEMEEDVREFREELARREISIADYLESNSVTEEQLVATFRARAETRLTRGLVLGEIARTEGLQLSDEDIADEIQSRAIAQRTSVQAMRAFIDKNGTMETVRNTAYTKKVVAFVMAAAKITDKAVTREELATAAAMAAIDLARDAGIDDTVSEADQGIDETGETVKPKRARKKAAIPAEAESDAGTEAIG